MRKRQVNKLLNLNLELNLGKNIKYKVGIIKDSVVYTTKTIDQLSGLDYFIF